MAWTRCPGRLAPQVGGGDAGPGLFEATLVTLMERPFGWFVVADPCDERLIETEMRELHHELRMLRRGEDEQARLAVARADQRLAELDAFREAGLWQVRVVAGAATQGELSQIAPVLVGSMELGHHPYRLRSGQGSGSFGEMLRPGTAPAVAPAAVRPMAESEQRFPFVATAGALAALAGLPRREVPGLRVLDAGYFDVTSETEGEGDAQIELGAILDGQDREVGRLTVPRSTINRHVFVTGSTGAGKSQTVRHLLEQLTRAGIPWLAIEPAKSEYAAMAGRIRDLGGPVTVVNPSDPGSVPLSVNPLAPEPGYPVQAHIDMVRALFQAAFDAEEPFPQIMAQALQRVYEQWLGCSDRGGCAGVADRARGAHAGAAAERGASGDSGRRLRARAHGRRAGIRGCAVAFAADRLGGAVLRGRPPGRHRRDAPRQHRPRHRGRRERRGQGVPHGDAHHPHRRAPADAGAAAGPR
jgi:hypothetical protein